MAVVLFKRPISYMLEPFDVDSVKQLAVGLADIAGAIHAADDDMIEAVLELRLLAASLHQFATLLEKYQ